MRTFLLIALLLVWSSGAVLGGPNECGVLIIHNPDIVYEENPPQDYCEQELLDECWDAITQLDGTSYESPGVWTVYAAFSSSSSPRLAVISFGIEYDNNELAIEDWGHCGSLEIHTDDWPLSGSGSSIFFYPVQTGILTPICWFAGYTYSSDATSFEVTDHPIEGGVFGDDSVPIVLDDITDYSCLGFNGNPGFLQCPDVYISSAPSPVPSLTTWGQIKTIYR